MAFLPPNVIDDAVFPTAQGKDLRTAVRMIEEKWRRFYPKFSYIAIDYDPTAAEPGEQSGTDGSTKIDGTWPDPAVPTVDDDDEDAPGNSFVNPQAPGATAGNENIKYKAPVDIHVRVERVLKEKDLKRYGFDKVRTLVGYIPVSLLDRGGLTVTCGDRLIWDGKPYKVVQFDFDGYWQNTNIRLYAVLNLESERIGT